jgi:hypothetical protein
VKYLIVFSIFASTACSDRTGVPNNIIPPDSMQNIMYDVIMAGEYSSQYINKDSLKKDKIKANQELLADIFKIHHITREKFKESLRFYESRPDLNKKIFDSLAAYANRHRAEIYKSTPLPKPKPVVLPVK